MRSIIQMVEEFAVEQAKETIADVSALNERTQLIRQSMATIDRALSNPSTVSGVEIRQAMTTSSFLTYFGEMLSRAFYKEYPQRVGDWKDYTTRDVTPDFRPVQRMRMGEFEDLVPRAEMTSPARSQVSEAAITYQVSEFARAYDLHWHVLVNDDLSEVQRFPSKLLRAAARFEGRFVSGLYSNPIVHASLAALGPNYSRNPLPLSVDGIKTAYESFMARRDADGNPITVTPVFLVTNPVHELTCREILAGIDPTLTAPAVTRVTKDLLRWKGDPFIQDPNDWYLMAAPTDLPVVTVARLRGYESPRVYMKAPNMLPYESNGSFGSANWIFGDFETGALTFMVQDIIGGWDDPTWVGVTEFQGIFHGHI